MSNIDIIKTSCKVFGLYFIILVIINLREIILYLTGIIAMPSDMEGILMILGTQIYQAAFNSVSAFLLIFKTDWVTGKLKVEKNEELKFNLNKTDWIELSLVTISALTILHSVPELLAKLVNYIYFNPYSEHERQIFWTSNNKADLFYSIFKFAGGLFFLLNARNFARRLKKVGDKDDRIMDERNGTLT